MDHEIYSTVIISLTLIQEGQLLIPGKRMCTVLFNRIWPKPAREKFCSRYKVTKVKQTQSNMLSYSTNNFVGYGDIEVRV